jgi:hypothetical protein
MENVLRELRRDFTAAISSDQNDVTLDPSITKLREKIADPGFLGPFSIYSRSQLHKMGDFLSLINNACLKDNPLQVALAVDAVLKLFDGLEVTVRQSEAADKRIEARRAS